MQEREVEMGFSAASGINRIVKKKNGFSMVEVLIALLLLGIVGFGFLEVLANSSAHTLNADVRATAESIARTEMEYVKSLPYNGTNNPPTYTPQAPPTVSWQIVVTAVRLDPKDDGTLNDDGIQKITVVVQHDKGGTWVDVITLEGYKYNG
jgi:prepilin-type N-terminal cleavage/methylation domain-containing protein